MFVKLCVFCIVTPVVLLPLSDPDTQSMLLVTSHGDGTAAVSLTNPNSIAIMAYAVTIVATGPQNANSNRPRGRSASRFIRDAATNEVQQQILAGRKVEFNVGTPNGGDPSVSLRAAIFEDGTSVGDPKWVDILLKRRRYYYQTTSSLLSDLSRVSAMSIDDQVAQLKASQNTLERQAQSQVQADLANARSTAPVSADNLFDSSNEQMRNANLTYIADDEGRMWIRRIYGFAIATIQSGNPAVVAKMVEKVTQGRMAVVKAKPSLGITN
jgi:hypothetical protein